MAKPQTHKLTASVDEQGRLWIECPRCHERQQITVSDDWYSIDIQGKVWPPFVCMAQPTGRYRCFYEGLVWIVNYQT